MPEGKTPIKISPKIFIWVGMITIVIFFTSIIITAIDMVEYRHSRVITYSTMLIAVSLYVIYALLNRKQLIIDLPQKEQTKYLLVVIALITALQALVFLCIVL
jgi:hypothetical protein